MSRDDQKTPPPSDDDLMARTVWTADDIAQFLRVTVRTVGNYRNTDPTFPKARVLPGHRSVRWLRDDVAAWFHGLDEAA